MCVYVGGRDYDININMNMNMNMDMNERRGEKGGQKARGVWVMYIRDWMNK